MNIIGHPYVAFKTWGKMDSYLAAGSHLPDIFPFASVSVFKFDEIHEGGEKLLTFLRKNYPDRIGLAVGMICHSVKYGADRFNSEIGNWLLTGKPTLKKSLSEKIADCSSIDFETAKTARLHNYLWTGVDLYLLKNEKKFIDDLAKAHSEINLEEISDILARAFHKNKDNVRSVVDQFFNPFKSESLLFSVSELVKIWKRVLAGLPEKDNIDEKKTVLLFEEIYSIFEDQWKDILATTINEVRVKAKKFTS
jgi:hypothetical protein